MQTINKSRYVVLLVIVVLALIALVVKLSDLQIVNSDEYTTLSESRINKEIKLYGVRGKIKDSQGNVLAYNIKCYNLQFYRTNTKSSSEVRKAYTDAIIRAVEILQKNDCTILCEFDIVKNEEGEYVFDFGNISEEAATRREKYWRQDMAVGMTKKPAEIYEELLDRYVVPDELSDEMKAAVLGVWQDSIRNASVGAVTVAKNIGWDAVSEISVYSNDVAGFTVEESDMRVYPYKTVAAHVIGYLGSINTESQIDYYVNTMKYRSGDQIGVAGIEGYLEDYLTGYSLSKQGVRQVEMNSSNQITRYISEIYPTNGDDVTLTLNMDLQAVLEKALEENINAIYKEQMEKYNSKLTYYQGLEEKKGSKIKMAESGAAVVMNVNTGEILAMASYPSFDPNLFVNGISAADYEAIISDERAPLYNKAISSKSTPGSIFKMCTAIAGLSEGKITLEERISDGGYYDKYALKAGDGPHCWINQAYIKQHANQSVSDALKHSCNYFFYELADRLGIDLLSKWADNFGLTAKTGIELLNETTGQVGCQEVLYDVTKSVDNQVTFKPLIVQRKLKQLIRKAAEDSGLSLTDDLIDNAVNKLMRLIGTVDGVNIYVDDEFNANIRTILLDDLGISRTIVTSTLFYYVRDYLGELKWWPVDTITTGIGQGITEVTPIGVARYISSLVNGGFVYNATLIKEITSPDGEVVRSFQPDIFNILDTKQEYLDEVKLGMKQVVSDDDATATSAFRNFKYKDNMGGKSGTAEVSSIDIECNAWFVAFAPYENPEIAVVVYIPNGYSGGRASSTIQAAISYWMEKDNVQ